jgi:hypothetical protein
MHLLKRAGTSFKMLLGKSELNYLGHNTLSSQGIKPSSKKIEAVKNGLFLKMLLKYNSS